MNPEQINNPDYTYKPPTMDERRAKYQPLIDEWQRLLEQTTVPEIAEAIKKHIADLRYAINGRVKW